MAKQSFTVGQVLTAAQLTPLQQTAMLGGAASAKTASYTLVAADAGTAISMTSTSATTITVNTGLFAAGDTVQITNLGSGVTTITAGTATVNTSASLALAQYESGTLNFTSASAAIFIKGAGAAAASGGMTLLATHTLSGSTSTISSISGSYKSLFGVITGAATNGSGTNWRIDPNGSNLITNTVTLSGFSGTATGYHYVASWYLNINAAKTTGGENCWSFTIDNYASTTGHKPVKLSGQFLENNSSDKAAIDNGGGIRTNSAITSLDFVTLSGSWTAGTVLLYGVS
jgi:hypothetical protein